MSLNIHLDPLKQKMQKLQNIKDVLENSSLHCVSDTTTHSRYSEFYPKPYLLFIIFRQRLFLHSTTLEERGRNGLFYPFENVQ